MLPSQNQYILSKGTYVGSVYVLLEKTVRVTNRDEPVNTM
jgi:hypothetical protein